MKEIEGDIPDYSLPLEPGYSSSGHFEKILRAGHFAVTTEISPPDSANPQEVYRRAQVFDGHVDAINATDGSGANCHMSSIAVCALLTRVGYAMTLQISCRDRNRIAIQGDVLGAAAMGVASIMCITGDGVQAGDHPGAKPVFDLDSMSALNIVRDMRDNARFQSGRDICQPPHVFLGAAIDPFVPLLDIRALRLAKKVAAGAQFVQSQYCYDIARLQEYMKTVRDMGLHKKVFILVGVGPLNSARSAEWIREHVPGVHIPDAVIKRLTGARDQQAEGRKLCVELIQQIQAIDGIAGVHVMAFRQEESVARIIDDSGVLAGRNPRRSG